MVEAHWVFSFLVLSPFSLANNAKLGRRLNEYQKNHVGLSTRRFALCCQPHIATLSKISDHMNKENLSKVIGMLFIFSGIGYLMFPPFYEEGLWKMIVPLLSAIDFLLAYDFLKKKYKYQKYYSAIAIGSLIVIFPFYGESIGYYGNLAIPMMVVESILALACILLLVFTFKHKSVDEIG